MERCSGYHPAKIPAITSHSALKIARLAIADSIILTILQKRENRPNDSPLDIMKMQVA